MAVDSKPSQEGASQDGPTNSGEKSFSWAELWRTPANYGELGQNFPELGPVEFLVAGACAGAIAKSATAPLSRVSLLYQVDPNRRFSVVGAVSTVGSIVKTGGVKGLWRGHVATLWRVIPFAGIQFLVFDECHSTLMRRGWNDHDTHSPLSGRAAMVAGATAGATATMLTYPLDVLRARAAAHLGDTPRYLNYSAGVEAIIRTEGVRGLYRGIIPTVCGILPYGAVSFGTYEVLKQKILEHEDLSDPADMPVSLHFLAGCTSGVLAQLIAYPCNVVRRRLQVQEPDIGARGSLGFSATRKVLKQIAAKEGLKEGLFKGASLVWLKGPMTVGIAFLLNDLIKDGLSKHSLAQIELAVQTEAQGQGVEHAESEASHKLSAVEKLVCGGCAGAVAKSVIAPGDRIKILYQTSSQRVFTWSSAYSTSKKIIRETGLRGLWRGHVATLLKVVPYSATSYASFDMYKNSLKKQGPTWLIEPVQIHFIAGAAAGATATTLAYPFDLLRARMAAHWGKEARYNTGYTSAMRTIVQEEGVLALYSGLRPTLLGIVPYAGCSFCFFETFKAKLKTYKGWGEKQDLPTSARLGCGALAGLLAQSLTYPLDIIRRRMQVSPQLYRNEVDAVRTILLNEGIRALFKGLSMNWIKGPIAVGVSFTLNDILRERLVK